MLKNPKFYALAIVASVLFFIPYTLITWRFLCALAFYGCRNMTLFQKMVDLLTDVVKGHPVDLLCLAPPIVSGIIVAAVVINHAKKPATD